MTRSEGHQRRWRDYRTAAGRRPVKDFLDTLPSAHKIEIVAAMRDVTIEGIVVARHLRKDIYEVRAGVEGNSYRVLFASEGKFGQVLLALEAFMKKTQKTPQPTISVAEQRLADWRNRASRPTS